MIGRVSRADKVAVARDAGADHVIVDAEGQFAEEVVHLSGSKGVHVVYDGSGPTTFQASLTSPRPCGTFCWYGPVPGGPGPIDLMQLPKSIKIGYASFVDHVSTPALLRLRTAQLFDWIASGDLKVRIGGTYPLADAARAQEDLAGRRTTGKLLPCQVSSASSVHAPRPRLFSSGSDKLCVRCRTFAGTTRKRMTNV